MAEFYREQKERFYFHNGEKYIHESIYKERVGNLLDTAQSCQRRYIDAEVLLAKLLDNWFVSLIFGKQIRKHLEKYKNHKLKF